MKDSCTAFYTNQHLHDAIEADVQKYLARGGKIQVFPQGASAIDISQPKAMNRQQAEAQRQKRQAKLAAQIFNDDTEQE